ncbi:MAG: hypothetical protein JO356_03190 [Acidobacteria bacterium]|nr:hypothetical protein [Acidobacteriota bacterium]
MARLARPTTARSTRSDRWVARAEIVASWGEKVSNRKYRSFIEIAMSTVDRIMAKPKKPWYRKLTFLTDFYG